MSTSVSSFSEPELIGLLDRTAVQGCLAWQAWPELEVHKSSDICWICSSDPFPIFNVVLKSRMLPEAVMDRIDSVLAAAGRSGKSLGWYTTPCTRPSDLGRVLISRGFVLGGTTAGMALDLSGMKRPEPMPEGLVIEEVQDLEALESWSRLVTSVYEFPPYAANSWLRLHAAMGLGEDASWHHYLARRNGQPVAASSLFLGKDAALVASVATVPDARRQGIGTAVTLEAVAEAGRRGKSIAVTCSSDMGEDVYRKIGFEEICKMSMYLWFPS